MYRYYRCDGTDCPTKPIPADKIEKFIIDQIKRIGASPELQDETFRQAVVQVRAQRRGLKLEAKRLAGELSRAQTEVERLVATVSRVEGSAADAVASELSNAQERVETLLARQAEVQAELETVKAQDVDRESLARALIEFDELWSVLLTPERERILQLLIEQINFTSGSGRMAITWRLSGFGELATEVAP